MPVKPRTWAIIAGVGVVTATVVAGGYSSWHTPPLPAVPAYQHGFGFKYCSDLGEAARMRSSLDTRFACLAALLGVFAIIIGNVLEPTPPDAERRWVRNPGVLVMNFGLLLVLVAQYEFSRADAASLAASAAATAQAEAVAHDAQSSPGTGDAPDQLLFAACVSARATWLKSRVESSALAQSLASIYQGGKGGPSQTKRESTNER